MELKVFAHENYWTGMIKQKDYHGKVRSYFIPNKNRIKDGFLLVSEFL